MHARVQDREKATELRKKGYSYSDIQKETGLPKSTLSNWLKDFELTDEEKLILKRRKDKNISRGRIKAAAALRRNRLEREKKIFNEAEKEFNEFIKDPLFQVGVALYWAEGSKRDNSFAFTNSDTQMVALVIDWIEKFLGVSRSKLSATLYIHKPYAHENLESYWAGQLSMSINNFKKTVYKPTGLLIKKRPNYKGCLKLRVSKRKYLLKTLYWQDALVNWYKNM